MYSGKTMNDVLNNITKLCITNNDALSLDEARNIVYNVYTFYPTKKPLYKKFNSVYPIAKMPVEYLHNPSIAMASIEYVPINLKYFDQSVKNIFEVIKFAISRLAYTITFASDEIKNNRSYIIDLIKINPRILKYLTKEGYAYNTDLEIINIIITINPINIKYTPYYIKNNYDLIYNLIINKKCLMVYKYATNTIKENPLLLNYVLNSDKQMAQFTTSKMKKILGYKNPYL